MSWQVQQGPLIKHRSVLGPWLYWAWAPALGRVYIQFWLWTVVFA